MAITYIKEVDFNKYFHTRDTAKAETMQILKRARWLYAGWISGTAWIVNSALHISQNFCWEQWGQLYLSTEETIMNCTYSSVFLYARENGNGFYHSLTRPTYNFIEGSWYLNRDRCLGIILNLIEFFTYTSHAWFSFYLSAIQIDSYVRNTTTFTKTLTPGRWVILSITAGQTGAPGFSGNPGEKGFAQSGIAAVMGLTVTERFRVSSRGGNGGTGGKGGDAGTETTYVYDIYNTQTITSLSSAQIMNVTKNALIFPPQSGTPGFLGLSGYPSSEIDALRLRGIDITVLPFNEYSISNRTNSTPGGNGGNGGTGGTGGYLELPGLSGSYVGIGGTGGTGGGGGGAGGNPGSFYYHYIGLMIGANGVNYAIQGGSGGIGGTPNGGNGGSGAYGGEIDNVAQLTRINSQLVASGGTGSAGTNGTAGTTPAIFFYKLWNY